MTGKFSLLIAGGEYNLNRYRGLGVNLAKLGAEVDYQPQPFRISGRRNFLRSKLESLQRRVLRKSPSPLQIQEKDRKSFVMNARALERAILRRSMLPDVVLHIFGMSSPFWVRYPRPYVLYLDYTMALAYRQWREWAPYPDKSSLNAWLKCEKTLYGRASHIFTFGNETEQSVVADYGVDAKRVTTVRSGGQFLEPYGGPKSFGKRRILFNGSEFHRKGGDIVLKAFEEIRKAIPDATLTIVGTRLQEVTPGIENPGTVDRATLESLFLDADVVLAPARCDPFPGFIIEAMNFGVPAITSTANGAAEIVPDGAGLVLASADPQALAASTLSLLKDGQRLARYSDAARSHVRKHHTWQQVASRMYDVIRCVARENGPQQSEAAIPDPRPEMAAGGID